jgi:hypothetical protein
MMGWQPSPLSSFGLSSDNLGGGAFAVALEIYGYHRDIQEFILSLGPHLTL